jgi:1,4-dihydroxy-2-naphthoate octaprenyltransferase
LEKTLANSKPSSLKLWVGGARLRTLPLAIAPIFAASGVTNALQAFNWTLTLLCLAVALLLQIGVNFANDYSDGIRGTDDYRVGPARLTASKVVPAESVKRAALISLGLGALAGVLVIVISAQWWLLAVGALAVVAAWYYTGGKHPYGYAGLGELVVFVFFGLVAVFGTVYVQYPKLFETVEVVLVTAPAAVGVGLYASAVLMINNIRDIETDIPAGKKTLAVLIGKTPAKLLFVLMIWLPLVLNFGYAMAGLPAAFAFPLAVVFLVSPITLIAITAKTPAENILALKLTSYSALLFAFLLMVGLAKIA